MNKNTTPSATTETTAAPVTPTDVSVTRPGAALRRQARELAVEAERLDAEAGHPASSDLLVSIEGREGVFEAAKDTDGLTLMTAYAEEWLPGVVVMTVSRSSAGGESALNEDFLIPTAEVRRLMTILDQAAEIADAIEE